MSKIRTSAETIKKICLEAGADDVCLVDLDRESLEKEREGILLVYSLARSLISIIRVNNRENIQSPARYVADEEYHHTGDKISGVSREILRRFFEASPIISRLRTNALFSVGFLTKES